MCNSTTKFLGGLLTGGLIGSWLNNKSYKKAKAQDQATINAANQAAQNQVEQNKLANSVQSTEDTTTKTTDTNTKKLITQKVPLNTSSTGATVGSQTSVGLNLGGY